MLVVKRLPLLLVVGVWMIVVVLATQVQAQAQQLQLQPTHHTLTWKSNCKTSYNLDDTVMSTEESNRITGGCAKLTFCNRGNSYSDRLYGYSMEDDDGECLSPGPIIRMVPGKTYGLILCSEGGDGVHPGTNIHTHGPHISGVGNSDDITRSINPNSCGFYEYSIPNDHMGGTNWYHPHLHHHTKQQASGGVSLVFYILFCFFYFVLFCFIRSIHTHSHFRYIFVWIYMRVACLRKQGIWIIDH